MNSNSMSEKRPVSNKPAKQTAVKAAKSGEGEDFNTYRHLIRESVHGYVFWSLFQGLGPMIWFYPLNELGISGYEAFAALWFLQLVTGIPGVLGALRNRWALGCLRLLVVASLASFQAPTTLSRLIVLSLGNGLAMIQLTATLWSPSHRIRCLTCWGLLLGLMMFITSRIWFVSFVPTWWSERSNSIVVAVAVIATVDHIASGSDTVQAEEEKEETGAPVKAQPTLPTALGFGSLLYLTNWCFGEVSLLTRWTVRGYPDPGPQPYPWGIGILLALGFGLYMSACRHVVTSKVWWLMGTVAFGTLYYLQTWQAYFGGLVLAIYTLSIWPEMIHRMTLCPPTRSLAVVIVTFQVETFFFVWTVAYNFVPGGVYTREHTDFLIAGVMLAIFIGLFAGGTVADSNHTAYTSVRGKKMPTNKVNLVLLLTLCVGLLGFGMRYESNKFQHPVKKSPKQFTAAIWTYHHGYDNEGWPSLTRTVPLLNDTDADFITLLESDASKPFLGNNDLGMWLGEQLGMYVDFGPATRDHTWGNLILSKYPIVKSTHHLLPSPHGELAPAITATVNMSGSLVHFVVAHMGSDVDDLDRKLQSEFLARELKNSPSPVVFLGYVTSAPGSKEYHHLLDAGNVKDIDASDRQRWCEYIMYRGLIRLGYARISNGGLSDTEVQVGKFQIPADPTNYEDNVRLVYDEDEVPESVHFNPRFGPLHHGHGYFKHHGFHMSTPKYFLP